MTSIAAKAFKFIGLSTLDQKLTDQEALQFCIKHYCIKVPATDSSGLIVKAKIVLDEETFEPTKLLWLIILCFPVQLNENDEIISPPPILSPIAGIANFRTEPDEASITTDDEFDFSTVKYNFKHDCNALLFYATPIDHDVTVVFSCFKRP